MMEINISPEYSAQPKAQLPNPELAKAVQYAKDNLGITQISRVADQGCGALRHLEILMQSFSHIFLVDTQKQFQIKRIFDGYKMTAYDYINSLNIKNKQFTIINDKEFEFTSLQLDVIFNICVFDVVLPETRIQMLKSANANLKDSGYFILIIPRNDASILHRCQDHNKYSDGYIFKRPNCNYYTFYTNYRNCDSLIDLSSNAGLHLIKDFSRSKQICLIFLKSD